MSSQSLHVITIREGAPHVPNHDDMEVRTEAVKNITDGRGDGALDTVPTRHTDPSMHLWIPPARAPGAEHGDAQITALAGGGRLWHPCQILDRCIRLRLASLSTSSATDSAASSASPRRLHAKQRWATEYMERYTVECQIPSAHWDFCESRAQVLGAALPIGDSHFLLPSLGRLRLQAWKQHRSCWPGQKRRSPDAYDNLPPYLSSKYQQYVCLVLLIYRVRVKMYVASRY